MWLIERKRIPKVLSNGYIISWSVAFKAEHTFEDNKHSLVHVNLVQSQRIHANIGVDTGLSEQTTTN